MANYYGQARSNYFAVKDEEAFREDIKNYPVELLTQEQNGQLLFGFLDGNQDGAGLETMLYDPETEEETEISYLELFRKHLADDWVAVIVEVGSEKYRYFQGFAEAYNNKGETRIISLDDIYDIAKYLGENVTTATY
jgi:hypothetical protein